MSTRACRISAADLLGAVLVAAVAGAPGAGCDSSKTERAAPAAPIVAEGRVPMADGTRLYYRKVGDGAQVVVLPGDLFLHPAFDRLAPGRTLVYYDMRNR